MKKFSLDIPEAIERQLRRCRVAFQESIRGKLQQIVEESSKETARLDAGIPATKGPALRFYVSQGYRVTYEVNALNRNVSVINLRPISN